VVNSIIWEDAFHLLQQVGVQCDKFVPDSIADSARISGMSVEFLPLSNWEELSDLEIFDAVSLYPFEKSKSLIVVTEVSFFRELGTETGTGPLCLTIEGNDDCMSFITAGWHSRMAIFRVPVLSK
jgi:hypothetical protein